MSNDIKAALSQVATDSDFEVNDKGDKLVFTKVLAERTIMFVSKKKLTYSVTLKIDEEGKKITFSDMLKETSAGIPIEFGFKVETYKTGAEGRSGSIKEQSDIFGKKYSYNFSFDELRDKIKSATESAGYMFDYSIV